MPHWTLNSSPLVLATLMALSLNLLFRVGIRRAVSLTIPSEEAMPHDIEPYIERAAGSWGAREKRVMFIF